MKDFKLAMIQHDAYLGTKPQNLEKTIFYTRKAKEMGASLAVFPETNIPGHAGHPMLADEAEDVRSGPSSVTLSALAKELDIYIAAGLTTLRDGRLYNTQFITGPDGYAGCQDKIHLSLDEAKYFSGGTAFQIIELPFARIGMVICYDNFFPEVSRCLAVQGAEVLLWSNAARHVDTTWVEWNEDEEYQAKTVKGMKDYLSVLGRCRAIENRCFVGICNMTGESGRYVGVKANHAGGSFIIDPYGAVLAESKTPRMEDEIITADLSASVLEEVRGHGNNPFRKRKRELFGLLA